MSKPDSYMTWLARFPLRPIRNRTQHAKAMKVLTELMRTPDDALDMGAADYGRVLASLVGMWEREAVSLTRATPGEMLAHLIDARRIRPVDLDGVIGKSKVSHVLAGRRELSKNDVVKLADYFAVSPALFLNAQALKQTA
ncbi:MAG: type II toxin-antitoxin system HigA family antitoxin [Phycisphaerae bacterium]